MLAIRAYESAHGIPTGYINYAISVAPSSALHQLERGGLSISPAFFASFTADLTRRDSWKSFHRISRNPPLPLPPPPVPAIDGERLFWDMLRVSRSPDPYFAAALAALRATGKYKLAALTNDYRFPPGHPNSDALATLRATFDVFVASTECGMRKPEKGIYELALDRLGMRHRPEQVVFVDDIGRNCKTARELGMRTVKVPLEETWRAVRELEGVTGERLLPDGEPPPVVDGGSGKARL